MYIYILYWYVVSVCRILSAFWCSVFIIRIMSSVIKKSNFSGGAAAHESGRLLQCDPAPRLMISCFLEG